MPKRPAKPRVYWCVFSCGGQPLPFAGGFTRRGAIERLFKGLKPNTRYATWSYWKSVGYTVRKVHIVEAGK